MLAEIGNSKFMEWAAFIQLEQEEAKAAEKNNSGKNATSLIG